MIRPTSARPDQGLGLPLLGKKFNSKWLSITQCHVDAFAAATVDDQLLHKHDAESKNSPFGGPIAPGLYLVTVAMNLARDSFVSKGKVWIPWGFDRVRFRAPVPIGKRVRCITRLIDARDGRGGLMLRVRLRVEIEGEKIPAFTGNCSLLCMHDIADGR